MLFAGAAVDTQTHELEARGGQVEIMISIDKNAKTEDEI